MKQRYKIWMMCLLGGLFLFGCRPKWKIPDFPINNTASGDEETVLAEHSEIVMLLGYFRFLESLSDEDLALERTRTRKTLTQFHDPIHRLRLAMLLSLPLSDSQDADRALALLNENLEQSDPLDPTLRDFSLFLSASIRQFKKQKEAYQTLEETGLKKLQIEKAQSRMLTQKLKKLETRLNVLSRELKAESAQRKKFQTMIDGLKNIEENIIIRDKNN